MAVGRAMRAAVLERAKGRCEYCRFPEASAELRFVVDHVIARQHSGPTALENLALCCPFCNLHKGPNVGGVDPQSGGFVRLFNPRQDTWNRHFLGTKELIVARTAVARVTIAVLALNHPDQRDVRRVVIADGVPWPE